MNFFSQSCEFPRVSGHPIHHGMTNQNGQGQVLGGQAPSESARLRAKQGHATSAKNDRFSASSFLKFRIPRVSTSVSRSRGDASHERGSLTPSSLNPLTPRYCVAAFTLIELMAATTVLSVILLMMVGMQDQMSKAWANANRRTDATREARAAASLLATDFAFPFTRGKRNPSNARDQMADSTTNNGVPFCYSSNGTGSGITIPNQLAGSACLFAAATQRPQGGSSGDLALVGYYVAKRSWTNVNGFTNDSYNLHRYFRPASNAWTNLSNWFNTQDPKNLFPDVNPAADDVLAKNVAGFQIIFFTDTAKPITNGINYSIESSGNPYPGNKMQISIDIYPDDAAQKFTSDPTWANPTNIKRSSRTYEFRIDSPRS